MVDYSQVMQTAIVALCLSAGPGLQAGKIPLQNDQPATKKEGVDAFELRLQFKEKLAHCVDIDMHVDYCLAPRPEGVFSRGKKIKFYLNNMLVYNCSSSGVCTAHGALKENTRIKVASEGCKGIPFANIYKHLIGEYVAVAEDPPERFKASFNLTFCNREKSLELSLELGGEAANCVSQSHRDGYCLSVSMDGRPIKNKAFKCYLGSHLVYECSVERVCTGHGILRDNIRPKYVASDCYGIPFANVVPQAEGKYSCVVEDDTFLIEASYDLGFCSGSHSPSTTESQMEMTESVWNSTNVTIIIVGLSAVLLVIMGIICIYYKRRIKDNGKRDPEYLNVNTGFTESMQQEQHEELLDIPPSASAESKDKEAMCLREESVKSQEEWATLRQSSEQDSPGVDEVAICPSSSEGDEIEPEHPDEEGDDNQSDDNQNKDLPILQDLSYLRNIEVHVSSTSKTRI